MVGLLAGLDVAEAYPSRVQTTPLQRLSADLMRSHPQDFFRAGQMKLEREVETIDEARSRLNSEVLLINPSIQPQPDLSPLEIPLSPSPPPTQ